MHKLITIVLAVFITQSILAGTESKAYVEPIKIQGEPVKQIESEEQQYIVRYGTTYNYGSTIITEDGNEWTLIDAPEYENGTEVRVLFDSNKTQNVTDDIIIDVTERR